MKQVQISENLLGLSSCNGRTVPNPMRWNEFWQFLEKSVPKEVKISRLEPPLILAGWNFSSDSEKRERFLNHLEWACNHGLSERAFDFLAKLSDSDWYYGDLR